MPSELPRKKLRMNSSARNSEPAAIRPATGPARRVPSRNAIAKARIPPARATTSQSSGAPSSPARLNGVVKITGSGFQDGPVVVIRSPWATSRPQMIHAHGS